MGNHRRIGLTGGIASGKSTVGELLAGHGAVVIDADLLARQVVEPGTAGYDQVIERFGRGVLAKNAPSDSAVDGPSPLDRSVLGGIVFADPTARRDLEAIIHPRVREAAAAARDAAWADGRVVIQMIPLLVETGQAESFDEVVVVDVSPQVQLRRLMQRNGLSETDASARIASQASRAERLAAATWVIDNDGPVTDLEPQVDRLWNERLGPDAKRVDSMPSNERDGTPN